jgi:hypothetical protein
MNKFTPGEWQYAEAISAVVVIQGYKLKAIADFGKVDLPQSEALANAHLIAGAKELFEAAEWALSTIAEYRAGGSIETEQHMKRAHEQLYAAVAKIREAV